ncbi:MAG: transposase [Terriglobia bacterium]
MKKERKHYTGEEKVAILRRHLVESEGVSKVCDELGLQPTVFYRWQKEFFENGAAAFQTKARSNQAAEQDRIEYLAPSARSNPTAFEAVRFEPPDPRSKLRRAADFMAWAGALLADR